MPFLYVVITAIFQHPMLASVSESLIFGEAGASLAAMPLYIGLANLQLVGMNIDP